MNPTLPPLPNNLRQLIPDTFQDIVEREKARIYNVKQSNPYYRPTLNQYVNLLTILQNAANELNGVQEKNNELVNGLRNQINKVRDNLDNSITGHKIRFQIGKLVILK